jgi:hypothetical protein
MGRLEKIKKEHIKKVNKLLDEGHKDGGIKEKIVLKPSDNVTNSSKEFINKMERLN